MYATLSLYQPIHEHLKIKNKRGTLKTFVYVVEIGPLVKICPSESSAYKYLGKMGFNFNDNGIWEHKFKSADQINLEKNYKKQ